MRKELIGLLFVCLMFIPSCGKHNHSKHHKQSVKVHHLQDGRCCYQSDSGVWYWLILYNMNSSNSPSTVFYNSSNMSSMPTGRSPAGYVWSPVNNAEGKVLIPTEQEMEQSQIFDENIVMDERGSPEIDADGNLVDPDSIAPDNGYDADSSSSESSDSGSSDGGSDGGSGGGD